MSSACSWLDDHILAGMSIQLLGLDGKFIDSRIKSLLSKTIKKHKASKYMLVAVVEDGVFGSVGCSCDCDMLIECSLGECLLLN